MESSNRWYWYLQYSPLVLIFLILYIYINLLFIPTFKCCLLWSLSLRQVLISKQSILFSININATSLEVLFWRWIRSIILQHIIKVTFLQVLCSYDVPLDEKDARQLRQFQRHKRAQLSHFKITLMQLIGCC